MMNSLQFTLFIIIVIVSAMGIFVVQWKAYQDHVQQVSPSVNEHKAAMLGNSKQTISDGSVTNLVHMVATHPPIPEHPVPVQVDPNTPIRIASAARIAFAAHPAHSIPPTMQLDEYMHFLSKQPQCLNKPIFITMARVQSNLYWQLIEGFFHSMFAFGHLPCAVMVCVTGT